MLSLLFVGIVSFAGSNAIIIENMSCSSCVKQVNKAICQDPVMGEWFEKCSAAVIDSEKMIGEMTYVLKKNVTLDAEKKKKIEFAIEGTGRKVLEYK